MSSILAASSTAVSIPTFTVRNDEFLKATIAHATPPPGVIPNPHAFNVNGTVYIIISVIGLCLALMCTMMRMYTKTYLTRAVGLDDYACVLAMIGVIVVTGLTIEMVTIGMGMRDWNVTLSNDTLEKYFLDSLIVNTVYFMVICLMKMSIIFFYLRVFTASRKFRWAMYAILVVLVLTHLLVWIFLWAHVSRLYCNWRVYPTLETYLSQCTENFNDTNYIAFVVAFTIVLDIILLVIPIPRVWRLQMAQRQKIAVLCILMAGVVVTIASTLRLVYLIRQLYYTTEIFYIEFQVNLIGIIEADIGVICACLPTLQAFLKRFAPRLLNIASSSNQDGFRPTKRSTNQHSHLAKPDGKRGKKWRDEELVGDGSYVELGEDGKSDQSYAMTAQSVELRGV